MDKEKLKVTLDTVQKHIEEHPDEKDHYHICEAIWTYHGDGIELSDHYDDEMICDSEYRMYYLLPDVEGEETIVVCDGKVFLDTIENVKAHFAGVYCEEKGKIICKHCNDFVDEEYTEGVAECLSCGWHLDGTENPDPSTIMDEKEWELVEDGDYACLWRWRDLLQTHETKKSMTALWVRLQYLEEHCSELPRYSASFITVNPSMAGKKGVDAAFKSMGFEEDTEKDIRANRKWLEQVLIDYGTHATHFELTGNSKSDVLKRLMENKFVMTGMCGFIIDRYQNRCGATGWDFMRGDPLAGIKRYQKEQKGK